MTNDLWQTFTKMHCSVCIYCIGLSYCSAEAVVLYIALDLHKICTEVKWSVHDLGGFIFPPTVYISLTQLLYITRLYKQILPDICL